MRIISTASEIVETLRIARLIERYAEQYINRVYTDREMTYCQTRRQATHWYTAYWAGKEAVLKALGTGRRRGISRLDIELQPSVPGQTIVTLRGGVRDWMLLQGISRVELSLSYCRNYAVAHAIALGDDLPTPEDIP